MIVWFFGNTTVRNIYRFREGLIAIKKYGLEGYLRGEENEKELNRILAKAGVIKTGNDKTYSIGRKWRSALEKHGFLYPKPKKKSDAEKMFRMIGVPDTITPNGERLIRAETIYGQQECYLRSLGAYIIPSYFHKQENISHFSPLRFVLNVMLELKNRTDSSQLHFLEMAAIVQCRTPDDGIDNVVNEILKIREQRKINKKKKKFDREIYENLAQRHKKNAHTFIDYADANIRYLKATGLFRSKGKGIVLAKEKEILIKKLAKEKIEYVDNISYLKQLSEGAVLPIDNKDDAMLILNQLVLTLQDKGEKIDLSEDNLDSPHDIAIARYKYEDKLFKINELDYAKSQAEKIDEILIYLELFINKKLRYEFEDGSIIEIPNGEKPAYLEWIVWRAFLAINSLVNKPWEARGFDIDQDFLPTGHAGGGKPDMVFEFNDMVLVTEVTLTESSRQESAESESVRRHVAIKAEEFMRTNKKVFGLFMAINIDTNTANTFRLGEWYLKDDNKIALRIVPLPLLDFKKLLESYSSDLSSLRKILKPLLIECRSEMNNDAPLWKRHISAIIDENLKQI